MKDIIYQSNNSGGFWWLGAEQWQALEAAGWQLEGSTHDGQPRQARKSAPSLEAAIADWRQATGANPDARGCDCCGRPHRFYDAADYE